MPWWPVGTTPMIARIPSRFPAVRASRWRSDESRTGLPDGQVGLRHHGSGVSKMAPGATCSCCRTRHLRRRNSVRRTRNTARSTRSRRRSTPVRTLRCWRTRSCRCPRGRCGRPRGLLGQRAAHADDAGALTRRRSDNRKSVLHGYRGRGSQDHAGRDRAAGHVRKAPGPGRVPRIRGQGRSRGHGQGRSRGRGQGRSRGRCPSSTGRGRHPRPRFDRPPCPSWQRATDHALASIEACAARSSSRHG